MYIYYEWWFIYIDIFITIMMIYWDTFQIRPYGGSGTPEEPWAAAFGANPTAFGANPTASAPEAWCFTTWNPSPPSPEEVQKEIFFSEESRWSVLLFFRWCVFFSLSTMINHHCSSPFGEELFYCFIFFQPTEANPSDGRNDPQDVDGFETSTIVETTPLKINMLNTIISFANGWFSGSMLIFHGV